MLAAICHAFGPVENLRVGEHPDPTPGAGEVEIEIAAAGVNFPDGLMIRGEYQVKPPTPFIPGSEAAGIVRAVGAGVSGLAPGDRVVALCGMGAFAERVAAPADRVTKIPPAMDFATAAGLMLAHGTSLHALADKARLRPGETLLVLGAAGGVGLAAVELGAALGARVIAACGGAEKCALARKHGAEHTIDYGEKDLKSELKRLFPSGIDVAYDPVGGAFTEAAVRGLAWGGRLLVVGFAAGDIPKLPLNLLLLREAEAIGVFWGAFTARDPARHQHNVAQLMQWFAECKIRPHIGARFPLARTAEAISHVMSRQARGKVVVEPKQDVLS